MKLIRVIKASANSSETIVPLFDGFYNTIFENCWNHKNEVGQVFTDKVNDKITSAFPSFKYTYEEIDSPSQYNYRTDEIYARADFNFDEILSYLAEHKESFDSFAKDNFSSYDGYISFIPNNYDEFIEKLKNVSEKDLSSFIIGAVKFALFEEYGENIRYDLNEETYYDVVEQYGLDEQWEVDGFTYDTEKEARTAFKQVCDEEPSSDHVLMYNNGDESEEVEFYKGK